MSDPYEIELHRRASHLIKTKGFQAYVGVDGQPESKKLLDQWHAYVGDVHVMKNHDVITVFLRGDQIGDGSPVYVSHHNWREYMTPDGGYDPYRHLLAIEELRKYQVLEDLSNV